MDKTCTICNEVKNIDEFPWKIKKDGKKSSYCKVCQRKMSRRHYKNNKSDYIDKMRKTTFQNRVRIYQYLSTHPCIKCGENNPLFLDFDHRNKSNKKREVYVLARHGWNVVRREIEKCDVLCVKCHRLKTSTENNWYVKIKAFLISNPDFS